MTGKDQTTAEIEADLLQQQARNDKIMELLKKMDRLWPDDENGRVQSLIQQTEATKNVLDDCAQRLERRK